MGTLDPYWTPFLDGNWIIDTANTINADHFLAKTDLRNIWNVCYTNILILIVSENKLLLCYLFSFYLHVWSSPTWRIIPHHLLHYISEKMLWEFLARIYRGNLPQEFAVGFCRENFPQKFVVAICRRNLSWLFTVRLLHL